MRDCEGAAAVFLDLDGIEITMSEHEAVRMVLGLADGSMTQKRFAKVLRQHSRKF